MSHIFEALQKSEAERSRNRPVTSLPAELLRAAEQDSAGTVVEDYPAISIISRR